MGFNLKQALAAKGKAINDKKPPKGSEHDASSEKKDKAPKDGGHHEFSEAIRTLGGPELLDVLQSIIPMLSKLPAGGEEGAMPMPPMPPHPSMPMGVEPMAMEMGPDPVVDAFEGLGGAPAVVKVIKLKGKDAKGPLSEMADGLKEVRAAHRSKLLRLAFSDILQGRRLLAMARLADVERDALGEERARIASARAVLADGGDADVAAFRVRDTFASSIPSSNVRLAYTYLENTQGEGFQLCPKAKGNLGYAVPMELSKCRDKCVDSKVGPDGRVTCAFANWLRVSADSTELLRERLEKVRHNLNDETLGTIPEGKRESGMKEPESMEKRLDQARKGEPKEKSTEEMLGSMPKGFNLWKHVGEEKARRMQDAKETGEHSRMQELKFAAKKSVDALSGDALGAQVEQKAHEDGPSDETLEQMLAEDHEGIDDAKLQALTERLKTLRKNEGE